MARRKTHSVAKFQHRINRLLGTELDADACCAILQALGCRASAADGVLTVQPPSFRPDLEREADIAEEVGRVYGYSNIPAARRGRPAHALREGARPMSSVGR